MANGEDLVYDWEHNVVDDPTEWGFNWDYAECGTANPIPRENHATMWMVMNEDDPYFALQSFLRISEKKMKTIKCKYEKSDGCYKIRVIDKSTKAEILSGTFDDPKREGFTPDPNVGHYATFHAKCEKGISTMKTWRENNQMPGFLAIIPHSRMEEEIYPGYKVVSITGMGDDNDTNSDLATRFLLLKENEEVARCHMTYRDGSYDPSFGPTIEMIAVKQSHRGQGLGKVLWYHVRRFIEIYFTIECLNNAAPLKHVMVKATQVNTAEVEIRKAKDGSAHSMTFKEFLYDYCGFSLREQKGFMAMMFGSRRIKDEEGVLYIPLLPPNTPSTEKIPKPGKPVYREKLGTRMCQWCSNVGIEKLRCGRCGVALYCNANCQKKDWKRHKLWCAKTRDQVREKLIEQGNMSQDSDGNYILHANGPNRTFGQMSMF